MSRLSEQNKAIAFMILSTASFSLMNVFIRDLSADMHTTVIVFFRNFFCIFLLLPFLLQEGLASLRTQHLRSHMLRSAVGIIGMQTWFYCVAILPLNQATALSYTSPLFTTLFAALYLHEKLTRARLLALAIGFIGAMVILRPSPEHFDHRALYVLFATSMWGIAGIMVKTLTKTEPPLRIVFYMSCFMSLLALPPALYHWQWPGTGQLGSLLAIAVASLGAQLCLAHAFKRAEVASLMPYDFGRLIFTSLFAFIAFSELPDPISWIGAIIIVGSAAYLTRRESKRAAKQVPPPVSEG